MPSLLGSKRDYKISLDKKHYICMKSDIVFFMYVNSIPEMLGNSLVAMGESKNSCIIPTV